MAMVSRKPFIPARPSSCMARVLSTGIGAAALVSPVIAGPAEFCVSCSGPDMQYRCTFPEIDSTGAPSGLQLHCISTLAKEGGHQSCSIGRATKTTCAGTLKELALPEGLPAAPREAATPAPPVDPVAAAPAPSHPVTNPAGPPSDDVEMKAVSPRGPASMPAPGPAPKQTWGDNSGSPKAVAPEHEPQSAEQTGGNHEPIGAGTETETPALVKPIESAGKAVGDAAKSTGSALQKAGDAVGNAAKKSWKCLTTLFGDC